MPNRSPDAWTRRLAACGIAAPIVALLAFFGAAARASDYDHVADTISKLSARGVPGRWFWTVGLLAYSTLMACFAVGLRRRFGSRGGTLWMAVGVHALLMIGVALFKDDLRPGGFFSVEGAIHDVLSGIAFSALVAAMLGAVLAARVDRALRPIRSGTILVGAIMTAVGIAFLFTPPEVQGVPQRAFVSLAALWIVYLAVAARASPRSERPN